mgnify:CR=1 FL=1
MKSVMIVFVKGMKMEMMSEIIILFLLFVSIAVGFVVWFNSEEKK